MFESGYLLQERGLKVDETAAYLKDFCCYRAVNSRYVTKNVIILNALIRSFHVYPGSCDLVTYPCLLSSESGFSC